MIIRNVYVHRVIFLKYYQIAAFPCLNLRGFPLPLESSPNIYLNPRRPCTCWHPLPSSSPRQTLHRLFSCHVDLLFHSWSVPRSPPICYATVSSWPVLAHSLCLRPKRIFSEGPLLILQPKRAITVIISHGTAHSCISLQFEIVQLLMTASPSRL